MIKKILLLVFSIFSAALALMLWLSYCAGRWGNISFLGAETVGFVAILMGALISAFCLRKSTILKLITSSNLYTFTTIAIFIVLLMALRAASIDLLLRSYAAGFQKTALEVAPISKWQSLLPLAQNFLSSKNTNRLESMLPVFVSKVYPKDSPYCSICGDPGDLNVVVLWRKPTLVIAIVIGKHGSLSSELYRKRCADDVAVVVAR